MTRVVFCCDAGPALGVGHLMRCVALAEELADRGNECVFVADVAEMAWARSQLTTRRFAIHERVAGAPDVVALIADLGPAAVVLDSYHSPPEFSRELRATTPVIAIVDGSARGQAGDLYIDQNLDAEHLPGPTDAPRLAGLDYALLRTEVLRLRPLAPPTGARHKPPRVLAYFGGTDAYGTSPAILAALTASSEPFDATVVAPRPELRAALARLPLGDSQRLTVIDPTSDLMSLAAAADLVISAAGTSLWELLCIGAAAAVVCVADNQQLGYARVVAAGTAAGLGHLDDVRAEPAVAAAALGALLADTGRRDRLRAAGWAMVDGHGRGRVADAVEALIAARGRSVS